MPLKVGENRVFYLFHFLLTTAVAESRSCKRFTVFSKEHDDPAKKRKK